MLKMKSNDIKRNIKQITDSCTGIKIFLVNNSGEIFDSDIDNSVLDKFRKDFVDSLKTKYVDNDSFTVPFLSNSDVRKHALYQFDFDEQDKPLEFSFLKSIHKLKANEKLDPYITKNGFNDLKAIVVRLKNSNGKLMSFYQHLHNLSLVTPEKGMFLTTHKTRVVKLEHDVLRLGFNFMFSYIDDIYLIENISAFEKELGFDQVIHTKATRFSEDLTDLNLVEDMGKFVARMNSETSFARKFVKVFTHSAVIEQDLKNEEIIKFAMSKQFYLDKLKVTDDGKQFKLTSDSRCSAFLTLLDDEFLKSELTGQDYIAKAKDRAS